MTRQLFLGCHSPPDGEPRSCDQPAAGDHDEEAGESAHRPVARRRGRRVGRLRGPCRPGAEQTKTRENDADEQPEGKPAAEREQRRLEADPVTAAEREEIDDRDDERHEQRDQHELDRPAPHDAVARTRRSSSSSAPSSSPWLSEPSELLRRAAHLREPRRVEPARRIAEGRRRPVARGRERDRGEPGGDDGPLLVEREREAEIDQLAEETRVLGSRCRVCSATRGDGGRDQLRAGERGRRRRSRAAAARRRRARRG